MSNANVGIVFNMTGGSGGSSLKLETLAITKQPNKTVYKSGESFDPTGMVVTAGYGYGLTSDVTGYTVSPSVLTDGVTEVTVTYTEGRVTKTASVAVTVEKVLVSIAITTNPTKMAYDYLESFDPSGMVVTATFSDQSTAQADDLSYPQSSFTTLGEQTVQIDYTYEGVTKSTTLKVIVNPIEVAVPVQNGAITYDSTTKTPSWTGYDSGKMTLSGETEGVNAGTYGAKFTLAYGYQFPDGSDVTTVNWTIDRATIASLPTQSNVLAANGTPQTPTWDGYDVTQLTIGGDRFGTDAGNYTATFTPTANYKWWDGSTEAKEVTWTITSVIVSIPVQSGSLTYTGAPQTPEWDNFDQENSSVSVTPQTNAGHLYPAERHVAGRHHREEDSKLDHRPGVYSCCSAAERFAEV